MCVCLCALVCVRACVRVLTVLSLGPFPSTTDRGRPFSVSRDGERTSDGASGTDAKRPDGARTADHRETGRRRHAATRGGSSAAHVLCPRRRTGARAGDAAACRPSPVYGRARVRARAPGRTAAALHGRSRGADGSHVVGGVCSAGRAAGELCFRSRRFGGRRDGASAKRATGRRRSADGNNMNTMTTRRHGERSRHVYCTPPPSKSPKSRRVGRARETTTRPWRRRQWRRRRRLC